MRWYELLISGISLLMAALAWFGIRPTDVKRIVQKIGGLLNFRIAIILIQVLGLCMILAGLIIEVRAQAPLGYIITAAIALLVTAGALTSILFVNRRYE